MVKKKNCAYCFRCGGRGYIYMEFSLTHCMMMKTSRGLLLICVVRLINCTLHLFGSCGPKVLTKLFESYCLPLTRVMDVRVLLGLLTITNLKLLRLLSTIYYIIRKTWKLPYRCHTGILHHVSRLSSTTNRIIRISYYLFSEFTYQKFFFKHAPS